MLTMRRRSRLTISVIAAAMTVASGMWGVAQQAQYPGGPFTIKQQNEAVGQCQGNWVILNGAVCDAIQTCNPMYRCFPITTPCGVTAQGIPISADLRRTIHNVTFGFCAPAYLNRQCKQCNGNLICEVIRGYNGYDVSGNCAYACNDFYKKVVADACDP